MHTWFASNKLNYFGTLSAVLFCEYTTRLRYTFYCDQRTITADFLAAYYYSYRNDDVVLPLASLPSTISTCARIYRTSITSSCGIINQKCCRRTMWCRKGEGRLCCIVIQASLCVINNSHLISQKIFGLWSEDHWEEGHVEQYLTKLRAAFSAVWRLFILRAATRKGPFQNY